MTKKPPLLCFLLLLACGSTDAAEPARLPAGAFAVRGARVFDGERVIGVTDVLVAGGRIAAVGERIAIPDGVAVVDGRGKTLLPGLIDAHVHVFEDARRDALLLGVTTELDMFSDWRQLAAARAQRASFEPTAEADLWSAGTLATAAGGHGTQFGLTIPTLAGPDQAPAWVAARVAEGSDWIKIVREDGSAYGARDLPTLDAATAARSSRRRMRATGWPSCMSRPWPPGATASRRGRTASPTSSTIRWPTTAWSRSPAKAAPSWSRP